MLRFLTILLLLSGSALGQELSVVKLSSPAGQGSGVVVRKVRAVEGGDLSLIATARHVLLDRSETYVVTQPIFTAEYMNGQQSGRISYAHENVKADLALVWAVVPTETPVAEIADTPTLLSEIDDTLEPGKTQATNLQAEFIGFALGDFRRNIGRPSFRHEGLIQSDATLIGGQSGGGMFINGKLVGIISGGNQWYRKNGRRTVTWPARCADAALIPPMIESAVRVLEASPPQN